MSWVLLAALSYLFSALSQTFDKVLLQARIPSAAAYAFYAGVTSIFAVIILPFGFALLPPLMLMLAFTAGGALVAALYFLYVSLRRCDVSRIVPLVGGALPVFLLVFSAARGETLLLHQLIAVFLFVAGGIILAIEVRQQNNGYDSMLAHLFGMPGQRLALCSIEPRKGIMAAIAAAFFFAGTFFLSKELFTAPTPFISEFFWMRMGSVIAALGMLLVPWLRRDIFETSPLISHASAGMFFGNKVIGAASFLLLNLAFNAAPSQAYVVIINALKGTEHLFVLLFSIGLTLFLPHILREDFDRHTLMLKSLGIALIAFGFLFLQ